jgi:RNA polymerase sigma factor (sigma-70 family)
VCTISDTEFKELIRIGRETDRYEFLLESCFFDYIGNLVKDDEDAKQELILKLIESFDRVELDEDKNYNLLKYYKYRINYWFKNYKAEKNGIIKMNESFKISKVLQKDVNLLTEKELSWLKKYKNIKHMDEFKDNEYNCYDSEDYVIKLVDLEKNIEKLDDKQKDILFMKIEGNTLQEIGVKYNCTRENIRQILEKIKIILDK